MYDKIYDKNGFDVVTTKLYLNTMC